MQLGPDPICTLFRLVEGRQKEEGIPGARQVQTVGYGVGRRERQWRGVREGPTEDPVKNGACLTNVRPRRGL